MFKDIFVFFSPKTCEATIISVFLDVIFGAAADFIQFLQKITIKGKVTYSITELQIVKA